MMTGSASESASLSASSSSADSDAAGFSTETAVVPRPQARRADLRVDRLTLGLSVNQRDIGDAARLSQMVRDHVAYRDDRGIGRGPLTAGLRRGREFRRRRSSLGPVAP